jgi:hypothetical protein
MGSTSSKTEEVKKDDPMSPSKSDTRADKWKSAIQFKEGTAEFNKAQGNIRICQHAYPTHLLRDIRSAYR